MLLMFAFAASVALSSLQHVHRSTGFRSPQRLGEHARHYRLVPAATLFFTFYVLFYALTPARYRKPAAGNGRARC